MTTKKFKSDSKYVLILRGVRENMTSQAPRWGPQAGFPFKYPKHGWVACQDWQPHYECGHGLHGFLWGFGTNTGLPEYARWNSPGGRDAKWLVIRCLRSDMIPLGTAKEKVKFKKGFVIFCGTRQEARKYIKARRPRNYWHPSRNRIDDFGLRIKEM